MQIYLFSEFFTLSPEQQKQLLSPLHSWHEGETQFLCFRYNPTSDQIHEWEQLFSPFQIQGYWHHVLLHPLDFRDLFQNLIQRPTNLHQIFCTRLRWKYLRRWIQTPSAPVLHSEPKLRRQTLQTPVLRKGRGRH